MVLRRKGAVPNGAENVDSGNGIVGQIFGVRALGLLDQLRIEQLINWVI
jgi:hypothetical protein